MTDNQSQSWRNGLRLWVQNELTLVFLVLAVVTVSSCRQNAHLFEEQVQAELLKSSENMEGMAERLLNFIHLAYANDTRKVKPFFEKAKRCSADADRFYEVADSLLVLSDKELSNNALQVLKTLHQSTLNSMLDCTAPNSRVSVMLDSMDYSALEQLARLPKMAVVVLRNSVSRMEYRVMAQLLSSVDAWDEGFPYTTTSATLSNDGHAKIRLDSKGFQGFPNRSTIVEAVFFNGKPVKDAHKVSESWSFAEVDIENAKTGTYRLVGRIRVIGERGESYDYPLDKEVEVGFTGN